MLFNPDPSEPVKEAKFSRKEQDQIHPTISLNHNQVKKAFYQ